MNAASTIDNFTWLEALGYGERLIPIIPPLAPIRNPTPSQLKGRGKRPGERQSDGLWLGLDDWRERQFTSQDRKRWAQSGAGCGIRVGDGLLAIDADCLNPEHAAIIDAEVLRMWGPISTRVGQAPKALYPVRVALDLRIPKFRFGDGSQIEFLRSIQFVAAGQHPKTLAPYAWTRPLAAYDDLRTVTQEEISEFLVRLGHVLPAAKPLTGIGEAFARDRAEVDQETLRGRKDLLRAAVDAIPNNGVFTDRDHWFKMACALRAALPEDQDAALEIFRNFSERWTGGDNDDDYIDTTWRSIGPPYGIGAGWIYDQARITSGGAFHVAPLIWHERPELPLKTIPRERLLSDTTPQRWVVDEWIPHGQTTLLSGDGGVGKSLISLQLAVDRALGRDWMGKKTEPGASLFLTAEDEEDEIKRRLRSICLRQGADLAEVLDRLEVISLHGEDAVLATPHLKDGMLRPTTLYTRLMDTIEILKPTLVILDTQADLFGGDENKRMHARQFIGLCQRMALERGCAVVLLAHPSVAGLSSGSGVSGTTAWSNSVRSRIYLSREVDAKGAEADRNIRILEIKKANRSETGQRVSLTWSHGCFSPAQDLSTLEANEDDAAAFLRILRRRNASFMYVTTAQNSPRYAPRTMLEDEEAKPIGEKRLVAAMAALHRSGRVTQEEYGKKARPQYRLIEVSLNQNYEMMDLFGEM